MGPTRPLFLSSREPFATTGVFQTKKVWIPSPFWTRRSVREVLSSSVPCRSSGLARLVASRRPKHSPRSEEELPVYQQLTFKTSSSPSSATIAASASPALRSVNYDDDDATSPKPGTDACNDEDNGSDSTCAKPNKDTKTKCKLFTGKSGVKNRDKLRFSF